MTVRIQFDPDQPLTRCKGESRKANDALLAYCRMGPGRNLRGLTALFVEQAANNPQTKPPTTKWGTVCTWSANFAWPARALRADEIQREDDRKKLQEERLQRERVRAQRRDEWEDQEYQLSQKLTELALQILAEAPEYLKRKERFVKGKNGAPDQLIITLALDGNLAVQAGSTASRLARLSTGLSTDNVEASVTITEDIEDVRRKRWEAAQAALLQSVDDPGDATGGEDTAGGDDTAEDADA